MTTTNTPTVTETFTATYTATMTLTNTPNYTATPTQTATASSTAIATSLPNPVVYPNPVRGTTVNLQLPGNNLTHVEVQIFTLSFRELRTINVPQVIGNTLTVPLVDKSGVGLANGLYYFVIHANGQKWLVKVLVLR
jgi:hypothetical protein